MVAKKKRNLMPVFLALSLCLVLISCFSVQCYASPLEDIEDALVQSNLEEMANRIYEVYALIRNKVAIPLIILSIASCGFQVIASQFFETGPNPIAAVYKRLYTTIAVLGTLFALPHVIGEAIELLKSSAWKPATGAFQPVTHIFFTGRWFAW